MGAFAGPGFGPGVDRPTVITGLGFQISGGGHHRTRESVNDIVSIFSFIESTNTRHGVVSIVSKSESEIVGVGLVFERVENTRRGSFYMTKNTPSG